MRFGRLVGATIAQAAFCSSALGGNAEMSMYKSGEAFDAVPYGYVLPSEDGKSYVVKWGEPRKIREVVVEFPDGAQLPKPGELRLEFWHRVWDGKPDPILGERGAGGVGWAAMDDWTNGEWLDSRAQIKKDGQRFIFTFPRTSEVEPRPEGEGVTYRKTLKIRLISNEEFPMPVGFRAFTDSVWQPLTFRLSWGTAADDGVGLSEAEGRIEAFNGAVLAVRPLAGSSVKVNERMAWTAPPKSSGGIEVDALTAVDPVDSRYDRTVVTVRMTDRSFSFAADEVARGKRILVDALGMLVTRGDDNIDMEAYRQRLREFPGRTVYDRIFDEAEQTLARAWDDMPLKRPFYFVHGLPGNRNAFHQGQDGAVLVAGEGRWFSGDFRSAKDSDRKAWPGHMELRFGFPGEDLRGGRELKDGYLPLLRTWWQDGPVFYELFSILDTLDGRLDSIRLDDPTVLLMRLHLVNTSDSERGEAKLAFTSMVDEQMVIEEDKALGVSGEDRRLRYLLLLGAGGETTSDGASTRWTCPLSPGERHTVEILVPSITLVSAEEIAGLRKRDFDEAAERLLNYWRGLTEKATQIRTPEPWINDFYKSHLRHLLVNCQGELNSDRLHAHVGTFGYGVYPDESSMMISDLDRRGYHDVAERCLESYLDYQGTVALPGNFTSTQGLFYGAGGHECAGYNKSHGWALWNLADHWWMTRDRDWMAHAASKIVAGCDWVIRERKTTMQEDENGRRPIEYGFLPAGSLEDVTDYWYWLVTNACTVWGFRAAADALTDYGHPEAERLQKEAQAFYDDVMQAIEESRVRIPVVRLRDGTCVPKYPSRLYERGRCHGWLRETLEGSIHILITQLMPVDSPNADWILKDFEDNLYISDEFGYAIPSFDRFWFSRGGFSMQANLLGGPLPYLYRDEIRHFLRAYFNAFASAFYPETRMCNEHSLPELGYPAGDHFKASDEAQSTYWLRLMFVYEEGENLHLGRALPRYWLATGQEIGIERAPSRYGPLSFTMQYNKDAETITAHLEPPRRNPPKNIYLRFRHPEGKPIQRVEVNGREYADFSSEKEWVIFKKPPEGETTVTAHY